MAAVLVGGANPLSAANDRMEFLFLKQYDGLASDQRIKWDGRMLLVNVTAFVVVVILLFAKDTPAGQWLDQFLLQGITRLGHMTRSHWIRAGAVLLAIGLLYWLAKVVNQRRSRIPPIPCTTV